MPTSLNKYRVKDLPRLTDPAQLLGKIMEVESTTTDQSSSVTMPLVIQTVADNLPASKKVTRLLARTFDTTDPNYLSGDPTLVSQSLTSDLVMYMTAGVEFPALQYRLKPDPNGPLLAYRDTTFAGPKLGARWVIAGSADDNSFPDFSPFTAVYPKGAIVKYTLGGQLRLFSAQQELVAANIPGGQQLPPTGLVTDPNWTEVNGEAAPNYSRLGQLVCRYYTVAERAADPYPVGDTVEELTAREVAGAGILYSGRTVRVELGPNAGTYRVVYAPTAPEYQAYIDGSFAGGQNSSRWEIVPASGVTQAYVDAADAALGARLDATDANADRANDRLDTLVANAPQALDTLKEISDQLAADEQGTAAILATQQQHTQQLADVVHKSGDEAITGAKTFTSSVTASFFIGDASQLTNIPPSNHDLVRIGNAGDNNFSRGFLDATNTMGPITESIYGYGAKSSRISYSNHVIIGDYNTATVIGGSSYVRTGDYCTNIRTKDGGRFIRLDDSCSAIAIETLCTNVTIGSNCNGINIGTNCANLTLGDNVQYVSIGAGCSNVTVKQTAGTDSAYFVVPANTSNMLYVNGVGTSVTTGASTTLPPMMIPLVYSQGAPIATTAVDTNQASSVVIGSDFLWDSAYAAGKTVLMEICCSASTGKTLAASLYTLDGVNVSGSGISGFSSSVGLARTGTFTLVHGTTYQVRIAIGSSGTGYLHSARLIIK